MRQGRRLTLWISLGVLLLALLSNGGGQVAHAQAATQSTSITIDGSQGGRTFDGIGALSAGASSRLLIDYPEPQRSQILDYLFKPDYGASLQILKVEIGGDTNSTDGSEASHMHSANDQNYTRGYEWWLMQQAKERNPNIKLYALEWGAPGWIGGGNFFSQDNVNYIIHWLQHAQSDYNLHIDYVGIWNERAYNASWIESLKSALQSNSLNTQLVAADDCCGAEWNIATDMNNDPTLKAAVDIVGAHYPGTNSPTVAQNIGKPIWSSEDGPWNGTWGGATSLAKTYNRNYINGKMTATIVWSPVTSYYDNLPIPGSGLMYANTPWSGYYNVQPAIWATAHTTQFTEPGWQYIDSASGYLAGSGSYVTLKSPNGHDFSTIIETVDASTSQNATFTITGGLSNSVIHVWRTNASSSFQQLSDITPSNGTFSLTLDPDSFYTLTTTTGQSHGAATPPANSAFPTSYSDNFDGYSNSIGDLPRYLSDQAGSFELGSCAAGRSGQCLNQQADVQPIQWTGDPLPFTYLGASSWTNYSVSVDALISEAGHARVIGRLQGQGEDSTINGCLLDVQDNGTWQLLNGNGNSVLASGSISIGLNTWHNLKLSFTGNTITAFIDNNQVANVTDNSHGTGQAGFGSGWNTAEFDNFSVQPISNAITVDDSVQGTGANQFNYVGSGWGHCSSCDPLSVNTYDNTDSWDIVANEYVSMAFYGTSFKFYGVTDSNEGIGEVSIDGGAETPIDFYSASRQGDVLLWSSPTLAPGNHTFKLRVTGTKDANSSYYYVAPDRADILNNPPTIIDDSVLGTGTNQFNYVGSGWGHCTQCNPPSENIYNNSDSWDIVANDYVTLSFTGTSIQFYGIVDTNEGIGEVSIDGGTESAIDFYATARQGTGLLWSSPVLSSGTHTFKLRVTGNKDASSSYYYVAPDAVEIYS